MLPSSSRVLNVPALLLSGVLALSLGLNGWLLACWPESEANDYEANDGPERAALRADLNLTQRLLLQCQQRQYWQDSLASRTRFPLPGTVSAH